MTFIVLAATPLTTDSAHAQVSVTTYHNDNSRSGANTQETLLTPANVNVSGFGKLFSVGVDGDVYAQPLLLSAVPTGQGNYNILYVATEHDSVYAIDADNGTVYDRVSLIPGGGSTVNSITDLACGDLVPEIGITGTPVIDPSTNTLYVVAKSKVNGRFFQYLHALDLTNHLTEKFGGPVLIQASVPGTGYDATVVNGQSVVQFDPKRNNQRAALLLTNGHVVIAWASHCDEDPYHGWVMSYNATTLAQEAVYNDTSNGQRGGIWMSGGGPAADLNGNIYFPTGNGTWSAALNTSTGTYSGDLSDSIVKLGPPAAGAFPILDFFTPYNQGTLDADDSDVAAGGALLLPPTNGNQLLVQQGKQGTIYLLNTATGTMGEYCVLQTPACTNSDPQIVQEIMGASAGIWGSPAYWNGHLYWTGANNPIGAWSVTFKADGSATISTAETSVSNQIFAFSAPTPSVSASGSTNGILWALDGSADDSTCGGGGTNCLGLYAYDANNLANLLYNSMQATGNYDSPGVAHKFQTPIIANGKVYVGTVGTVTAYGLLGSLPMAASPIFSPAEGTYGSTQSVSISSPSGGVVYYTTDGTTPTRASNLYTAPINVGVSETIRAIAVSPGTYSQSPVASASYTLVLPPAATPTFSVPAGTYATGQSVSISDATAGATIYYTTDGSTPTTGSIIYTGPISVTVSQTLQAIAIAPAYGTSAISSADYAIAGSTEAVNYPQGFSSTQGFTLVGGAVLSGAALQLTSSSQPVVATAVWTSVPVNIQQFVTDFDFQILSPVADGFTFAIQNAGPRAVGGAGGSLGYQGVGTSVAIKFDLFNNQGEGPNSTGFYTNGASPMLPALDLTSSGINLHSGNVVHAHVTYDGTRLAMLLTDTVTLHRFTASSALNIPGVVGGNTAYVGFTAGTGGSTATQTILDWTFEDISTSTAAPTFSPAPGTYTNSQSVRIADATIGAAIYYTLDGSTPTTSSTLYSGPISVATTTTINAIGIAVASGYTNSGVSTATYTITPPSSAPTFSPAPGTYTSAQSITISDATSGATIYYTTDGSTPTTASTLYSAPISVAATTTINAIAVANGYTNSGVASATFTITPPAATPTFSVAPGSYTSAQSVAIADATAGAAVYYTTDGSTPTTSSSLYSGPISVTGTTTINAIAVASGYSGSNVATGTYAIAAPSIPTYDGTQLRIPSLTVGSATYTNVVVTIDTILSGPTGTAPTGQADTYDPATRKLSIPAVISGLKTYYNVVATVRDLVSIGSASGVDSYDGTNLSISAIQAGSRTYRNLVAAIPLSAVVHVAGGMPGSAIDSYDAKTGLVILAAVEFAGHVYTNVTIMAGPGNVISGL